MRPDIAEDLPEQSQRSGLARIAPGRLRRSTLVNLRWGAVAGQALAVLIVVLGLRFAMPVLPAIAVIGTSALVNLAVAILAPLDRRVSDGEAVLQLGFDIVQLAALLWLSGGLTNPFVLLFIGPVVTSAATLRLPVVAFLMGLTAMLSLILMHYSAPLPWFAGQSFSLPATYKFGLWTALMIGMGFTSLYAWRASSESQRMSNALSVTEAVLAQEQKLSALGGLAAAAAHELGTPLATIQVTAKEMANELPPDSGMYEDARLVVDQAKRCRDILQQLGRRGDEGDAIHDVITLGGLFDEVVDPFTGFGTQIEIELMDHTGTLALRRSPEIIYGLTNLVENAVDFARTTVTLRGRWDNEYVHIDVLDDGKGFEPQVRSRLGEPYVTSREGRADQAGGLGLGFFIAKTLIERTGGTVTFGNRRRNPGAFVRIRWPRARFEARAKL
ncbi:ActS/PrrB/RegB family redox-sensitive histidine kinase [Robiginitomaculum antarcticum]|uniref:ActS/PrrB/RegB family redox-sensitive histidine kinase n=1 Tax=Robiginitomaculum antarcticum TaxID=437507 RepID=UPI0003640D28|nr:ActS/PrrB/RegB family redox-sensitive histidine kinase [Robiginitomaculum antarcticum]